MKKNRVYTAGFSASIVPGATSTNAFFINNTNREALLKSISLDLSMALNAAPFTSFPPETTTTMQYVLMLQAFPLGSLFAQPISEAFPVANLSFNGTALYMYKPGQLNFNSFYIANTLRVDFSVTNRDTAIMYYRSSIIIEIEDIPLNYAK